MSFTDNLFLRYSQQADTERINNSRSASLASCVVATNYETDYAETSTANAVRGGMAKVVEGEKGSADLPAIGGQAEARGGGRDAYRFANHEYALLDKTYSQTRYVSMRYRGLRLRLDALFAYL